MKTFQIDGKDFSDLNGFFNAIGHQLVENNDWGKNWNAFNDILWGGFIKTEYEEPYRIIWLNHNLSKEKLADFDSIISLIKKHTNIDLLLR